MADKRLIKVNKVNKQRQYMYIRVSCVLHVNDKWEHWPQKEIFQTPYDWDNVKKTDNFVDLVGACFMIIKVNKLLL